MKLSGRPRLGRTVSLKVTSFGGSVNPLGGSAKSSARDPDSTPSDMVSGFSRNIDS